jgi:DNA-binding XRE family transcriptional regulator
MQQMVEDQIKELLDKLKLAAGREYGGQAELARDLGVSRQRLNDWLKGRRTPDLEWWLKIQAFLKKPRRKK